jgi:hypothetical protein
LENNQAEEGIYKKKMKEEKQEEEKNPFFLT